MKLSCDPLTQLLVLLDLRVILPEPFGSCHVRLEAAQFPQLGPVFDHPLDLAQPDSMVHVGNIQFLEFLQPIHTGQSGLQCQVQALVLSLVSVRLWRQLQDFEVHERSESLAHALLSPVKPSIILQFSELIPPSDIDRECFERVLARPRVRRLCFLIPVMEISGGHLWGHATAGDGLVNRLAGAQLLAELEDGRDSNREVDSGRRKFFQGDVVLDHAVDGLETHSSNGAAVDGLPSVGGGNGNNDEHDFVIVQVIVTYDGLVVAEYNRVQGGHRFTNGPTKAHKDLVRDIAHLKFLDLATGTPEPGAARGVKEFFDAEPLGSGRHLELGYIGGGTLCFVGLLRAEDEKVESQ